MKSDGAAFLLVSGGKLVGMICTHVDDLLFGSNEVAYKSLVAIGQELGFGELVFDAFVYCGRNLEKLPDKVRLTMMEYHKNLPTIYVSRDRRQDLSGRASEYEKRNFSKVTGSL